MGRTVPTSNQVNAELIRDLAKVREGLTTDEKKLWDPVHADRAPQ